MQEHHEHKHKWYTFGCKDATLLLTKADYTPLSFSEKILVTFHTLICKYCRRFKAQAKSISSLFKSSSATNKVSLEPQKKEALNQLITNQLKK